MRAHPFVVLATVLSCSGQKATAPPPAPAATAPSTAPAKAPTPTAPPAKEKLTVFLEAPDGWQAVAPTGTLAAAWDGPRLANGLVPTMNVAMRETEHRGDRELYTEWRKTLLDGLEKQYVETKILSEKEISSPAGRGHLIVVYAGLATSEGKEPMRLFVYGAMFVAHDRAWVLAAITGATLDVKSGQVSPLGEAPILHSFGTFDIK